MFPVVMARGKHLFPFRTEQLSPSAPMVLGSQEPGRVGRRRFDQYTSRPRGGSSSLWGLRNAWETPNPDATRDSGIDLHSRRDREVGHDAEVIARPDPVDRAIEGQA